MAAGRMLGLAAMLVAPSRGAAESQRPEAAATPRDILFVMSVGHLPETTGGVESTTHELCLALGRRGWRPAVLCGSRRDGEDDALGYPVVRRAEPLAALAAAVRRFRPDVAVVQLGRLVPLARALVEAGLPTVIYFHNLEFAEMGGALFRHPRLGAITNSDFMAAALAPLLGAPPPVVPPLIDSSAYRTSPSGAVVTFVNPLPAKGLDIALHLAAARPDIPFEFVESWPLRPAEEASLAGQIAPLANVTLVRRTPDMRAVYGRSRLLLAPSRWIESWGRVASEAQVSGLPVIATRSGGLPEAVGPGGILVDADAPFAAWEAALATLWDDPAAHRRLSAAAIAHAARPDFQPAALLDRFVAAVAAHIAATAAGRCGAEAGA